MCSLISVEGLAKGAVWVAWNTPAPMPVLPSYVSGYYVRPNWSSMNPAALVLPPVMSPLIWHDTSLTPFGGRLTRLDVGTISSIDTSPGYLHPCDQSTITGQAMYAGDGATFPSWTEKFSSFDTPNLRYYDLSGNRISFCTGRETTSTKKKVFNQYGEKVSLVIDAGNARLYSVNTSLNCDMVQTVSPSTLYPYVPAATDTWYADGIMPVDGSMPARRVIRTQWTHVSANVWKERVDVIYHQNASYVPLNPIGLDGYGYVAMQMTINRTHVLNFVQQRASGWFSGSFEVVTDVEYSGYKYPSFYSGKASDHQTGIVATLCIMEPGLCGTGQVDTTEADAYCALASPRAIYLYSGEHMKTSRSRAIANVSGLQSNWIENLAQVKGALDVVKPLIDGYRAVKTGNFALGRRALAGAYLAYKYQIAPTISDAQDIHKNLIPTLKDSTVNRLVNERRRGATHIVRASQNGPADLSYYCTYHLQLKDNYFAAIWNALEKLGLDPSAANMWDLIPFSFVIDWFTKIGPALSVISAYNSSNLIRDLRYRIESFKAQWVIPKTEFVALFNDELLPIGKMKYTWYDRRIYSSFGSIDPFAGQSCNGLSVSQMTQGAALLSSYR